MQYKFLATGFFFKSSAAVVVSAIGADSGIHLCVLLNEGVVASPPP